MNKRLNHQCYKILKHIERSGSITSMECINDYGITRLAARIYDIKKAGFPIEAKSVEVNDRDGNKVKVAQYKLSNTFGQGELF